MAVGEGRPAVTEPADFAGRSGAALVTGGSGAIGAAIARLLAARGAAVAISYRSRQEPAEALVESLREAGVEAAAWPAELADADSARALGEAAIERFGAVHTLVHAAGPHIPQAHLSQIEPATMLRHLDQEAAAFFNVAQPLLTELRAQQGSIVAVTTAATRRYPSRDGLSAGPKAAVEALVRGIAAEEGRFGVRANCVGPGMLTDGMAERLIASGELDERALAAARASIPLRRFGSATDIAEAVCFLASDRANFITGQKLDLDGGYTT